MPPESIRQRANKQRHQGFDNSTDADAAAGSSMIAMAPGRMNMLHPQNQQQQQHHYQHQVFGSETDLLVHDGHSKSFDEEEELLDINASLEIRSSEQQQRRVLILGHDISSHSRKCQFLTSAGGVFSFSLLYGYLQELISVSLCNRQLGLFLAMVQFMGYALWSKYLNHYVNTRHNQKGGSLMSKSEVPIKYYIILSILRAVDASLTNMAMAYVNYPAKTLMKSSRVVFTMIFGTIISRKRYQLMDYLVVMLMVYGLVLFMHADAHTSAVFNPIGIVMLTTSLLCDGAINNMSERIMIQYNVGQDEFIYKLYSIALVGIMAAAAVRGDLVEGTQYLLTPGTYAEIQEGLDPTWTVSGKVMVIALFASTGFFGSSCSALITKEFGALTMSITSTARKATTLFLSFALFKNVCTLEHVMGIVLFLTALVTKSVRASRNGLGVVYHENYEKDAAYTADKKEPSLGDEVESESRSSSNDSRFGSYDGIKRRNVRNTIQLV